MKPKRKDKHLEFVEKNLEILTLKAAEGFHNQGKGVLIVRKVPGSNDINTTYIFTDEILRTFNSPSDTSPVSKSFQTLKKSLEGYNPETQFVLILYMKNQAKIFVANRAEISMKQ
jgi:hypothetical protein